MSQPVKLSDALVLDARLIGEIAERSISGQIEFWAGLGRAVEGLLRAGDALAFKQRGAAKPLSQCLADVNAPTGREALATVLCARPFPHYEPAPARPGYLVRIAEDGTRTVGRFVSRRFVEVAAA